MLHVVDNAMLARIKREENCFQYGPKIGLEHKSSAIV